MEAALHGTMEVDLRWRMVASWRVVNFPGHLAIEDVNGLILPDFTARQTGLNSDLARSVMFAHLTAGPMSASDGHTVRPADGPW